MQERAHPVKILRTTANAAIILSAESEARVAASYHCRTDGHEKSSVQRCGPGRKMEVKSKNPLKLAVLLKTDPRILILDHSWKPVLSSLCSS